MEIFKNKKYRAYAGYVFSFIVTCVFVILFVRNAKIGDFLSSIEDKTFDLRQSILANSGHRKASDDIVIVTIDDASYEYLLGKYGEWPIPRGIYADFIKYISNQKPAAIAFDLMFVKSIKGNQDADKRLVDSIINRNNVYVAMNFDYQEPDVRKPAKLPKSLAVDLDNKSDINFKNISDITFTNCRTILPQLINGTDNIGLINVSRSNDGILRKVPPFLVYQDQLYPHLALLTGKKYLSLKHPVSDKYLVDSNNNLLINDRVVPLDKDGGAILNWYGKTNESGRDFREIPLYKIIKAMESGQKVDFNLKNKIVYLGVTTVSLYDNKSVPVDKIYPGVKVHATFINNLIDNDFIKKIDTKVNVIIGAVLALLVGVVVIRTPSTLVALGTTILATFGYVLLSYFLMKFFNLWIAIVLPLTFIILMFVVAYIIKYILKSRDFEYQYKLATTDGLTELYNHRYFQEQMILQIANAKRYNSEFSLILIDIDFFKKFNDKYGHQSGDAVLRQVAKLLKRNVRATDLVCRYGGEEMTIILPNTDKNEAIITAQKLCKVISEKPCKLANNQESTVTISLGVSTFPQDGISPAEVIAKADEKLYFAKENGRNQVGY